MSNRQKENKSVSPMGSNSKNRHVNQYVIGSHLRQVGGTTVNRPRLHLQALEQILEYRYLNGLELGVYRQQQVAELRGMNERTNIINHGIVEYYPEHVKPFFLIAKRDAHKTSYISKQQVQYPWWATLLLVSPNALSFKKF